MQLHGRSVQDHDRVTLAIYIKQKIRLQTNSVSVNVYKRANGFLSMKRFAGQVRIYKGKLRSRRDRKLPKCRQRRVGSSRRAQDINIIINMGQACAGGGRHMLDRCEGTNAEAARAGGKTRCCRV
jgi:hypothetical protein